MTGDESPPQPNIDLLKKRRRRLIYFLIAVVFWIVFWSAIFYALSQYVGESFIYGERPGIYLLAVHPGVMPVVIIIPPTLALFVAPLIPGFLTDRIPSPLLFILILSAPVIPFLTILGPTIDEPRHVQTLRYGGHTYYLADRTVRTRIIADACLPLDPADYDPDCIPGYLTHEYFVYRCGGPGVMCQGIGYEAFEEHKYSSEGELSVNAEGSIVLTVDSRWVWTYPADDQ